MNEKSEQNGIASTGLLYGVVEWLGKHPILDGMKYFQTKEEVLIYAELLQTTYDNHPEFNGQFTIIRLEPYNDLNQVEQNNKEAAR